MAEFQVVVADPDGGKTYQHEVDGQSANRFLGRELGEEVDAAAVDLDGYTLELTGGSDETGRPMRENVPSAEIKELLLEGGVGFNPSRDGERKRITVRGRQVSDETAQVNTTIIDGDDQLPVALGEEEPEPDDADDDEADADEADEEDADEADEAEDSDADDAEAEAADEADEAEEADADDEEADADETDEADAGEADAADDESADADEDTDDA